MCRRVCVGLCVGGIQRVAVGVFAGADDLLCKNVLNCMSIFIKSGQNFGPR